MARDGVVEAIKSSVPLEVVVGAVVRLKRAGARLRGLCPFHEEKTPSFYVTPGPNGFYYCFGCHEGGDVIKFVMRDRGVDFKDAARAICEENGLPPPTFGGGVGGGADRSGARLVALRRAMETATRFYEFALTSPDGGAARAELARRGISGEVATLYRLGHAPTGGADLWARLKAAGVSPADAEDLWLVERRGGSLRDVFVNRLVCPIVDERAGPIGFSGRALGDGPKYKNSRDTLLFRKARVLMGWNLARASARQAGEVVLVEGNFDCVRMRQAGVENVAAVMGSKMTEAQAAAVARTCGRAIILFDGDDAGRDGAERAVGELLAVGVVALVAELPDGLDPDSACQEIGEEVVRALASDAGDGVAWVARRALARFGAHGVVRGRAGSAVADLIAKAQDPRLRAAAVAEAAHVLGEDRGALLADVERRRGGFAPPLEPDPAVMAVARAVARALVDQPSPSDPALARLRAAFGATPLGPALDRIGDAYAAIAAVAAERDRDELARAYATTESGAETLEDAVDAAFDTCAAEWGLRAAAQLSVEGDDEDAVQIARAALDRYERAHGRR